MSHPTLQSERDLSTKDFEVIKVVGRGTFGIVRKVRCKRDGNIYAIKSIPLQKKKFKYKYDGKGQLHEVEIMSDLMHPHVIHMIGSFQGLDDFARINHGQEPQQAFKKKRSQQYQKNQSQMRKQTDQHESSSDSDEKQPEVNYGPADKKKRSSTSLLKDRVDKTGAESHLSPY